MTVLRYIVGFLTGLTRLMWMLNAAVLHYGCVAEDKVEAMTKRAENWSTREVE